MRVEVVMPQMGESIVEGTIVEWLKNVGDAVEQDEDIFTLSTDKVDAEVPSPKAGVLVEIRAEVGETVEVGKVVAVIETDAANAEAAPAPAKQEADEAPAKPEPSSPAPPSAPASSQNAAPPAASSPMPPSDAPMGELSKDELRRRRSTPLVRKIAAEHGIDDLTSIEGTGVSGRVTKKDILSFIESGGAKTSKRASAPTLASAQTVEHSAPAGYSVAFAKDSRVHIYDNDRVEPMTRMRASIAENMLQARRTTAHCHTVWEADVTSIVKARARLKAGYAERGVKLTYTPFFVAAVTDALRAYPLMNAAIDGNSIVYRGNINVGVASSVEEGLIVPVLKGVDGLNLFGIARGVNDLAYRSKNKKLKPNDVADGTFTISNAGVWGSLFGVPILIPPQVGILGIGGIKKRVVADADDNIRIRSVVNMCLTFDHRLIDGSTADGFMGHVANRLSGAWEE